MKINEKDYVGFIQAIKDFWKGAVFFKGRTRRSGYWWSILFNYLLLIAISIIDLIIISISKNIMLGSAFAGIAFLVYVICIILPTLAMLCRRFQDVGLRFGWSLFISVGFNVISFIISFTSIKDSIYFGIIAWIFWIIQFILILIPSNKLCTKKEKLFFLRKCDEVKD